MMHQCPFCDELCDCDSDDTWGLSVPDDCPHVCDDPGDDETYPWGDDEDEDEPWERGETWHKIAAQNLTTLRERKLQNENP